MAGWPSRTKRHAANTRRGGGPGDIPRRGVSGGRTGVARAALLTLILGVAAGQEEDRAVHALRRRVEQVARELEGLALSVPLDGVRIERAGTAEEESTPESLLRDETDESGEAWALYCTHILNCDPYAYVALPWGCYVPWRKAIVFANVGYAGFQTEDEVIAHELAHVRQHGRHGLWSREWYRKPRTIEQHDIVQCLIEGEAEVVQIKYSLARMGREPDDSVVRDMNLGFEQGTDALTTLYPAYAYGRHLVLPVVLSEGWDGIARLHETPPVSTEQIIHPEKAGHDVPTAIPWPETPDDEASIAWQDTSGEMFIFEWLAVRFGRAEAWSAATGWDGDSWRVLRLSDGSRIVVWVTVWDREADAAHFAGAVRRSSACDVLTNGRVVVCAGGEDPEAARRWGERAVTAVGELPPEPRDAASTTMAEQRWLGTFRPPAVSEGWWEVPMLGVRVPAPPGWQQDLAHGAYVLRRHWPADPPDALMFVHVVPTGGPATVDLIERRLEGRKEREAVDRVLSLERVTVAGREAVLAEHAFGWNRVWAPVRFLWLHLPTDRGILMLGARIPNRHRKEAWPEARRALLAAELR